MKITAAQWNNILADFVAQIDEKSPAYWLTNAVKDDLIPVLTNDEAVLTLWPTISMVRDTINIDISDTFLASVQKTLGADVTFCFTERQSTPTHQEQWKAHTQGLASGSEHATPEALPDLSYQGQFFVEDYAKLPIKEDVHFLMVAPYTMQPRNETRHELLFQGVNGTNIRVEANKDYGLPHVDDYIIYRMMVSWLVWQNNLYVAALKRWEDYKAKGILYPEPEAPPRYFTPTVVEIFTYMEIKKPGATDRLELPNRLNRLKQTGIYISKAAGTANRRFGTTSLIADWSIVQNTRSGAISQVRIDIPNWQYDGVVKAKKKPTVKQLSHNFRSLKKNPLLQFIYRYCKAITDDIPPNGTERIPTADLHHNSASGAPLAEFNRELTKAIKKLPHGQFFDWHLSIAGLRQQRSLYVGRLVETLALAETEKTSS